MDTTDPQATDNHCSFAGCTRPIRAVNLALCHSHYNQHRKGEELQPIRRWKAGTEREVFYTYVTPTSGCWVWRGSLVVPERGGYGVMKGRKAHRISYELHKGPIPEGMHVCHACDNPPCVNPDHLFLGTDKTNAEDRTNKDRGRGQFTARLSDDEVADIRRLHSEGMTQREITKRFPVSQAHVSRLVSRKRRS